MITDILNELSESIQNIFNIVEKHRENSPYKENSKYLWLSLY